MTKTSILCLAVSNSSQIYLYIYTLDKSTRNSPSLREQAIGLYKGGSGVSYISQILNVNCSSAHYIIQRWKSTGSAKNLARVGCPQLLTQRCNTSLSRLLKLIELSYLTMEKIRMFLRKQYPEIFMRCAIWLVGRPKSL